MAVWSESQMVELEEAGRKHPKAHVRVKALALWNLGRGEKVVRVSEFVGVDRHTLQRWRRRYAAAGLSGLAIGEGRGRRSQVDGLEVIEMIAQSPRHFGLAQERWTLASLRATVPSLRRLRSLRSVGYVLKRLGLSWKRGQYRRLSPDPEYAKKKPMPKSVSGKRAPSRKRS